MGIRVGQGARAVPGVSPGGPVPIPVPTGLAALCPGSHNPPEHQKRAKFPDESVALWAPVQLLTWQEPAGIRR